MSALIGFIVVVVTLNSRSCFRKEHLGSYTLWIQERGRDLRVGSDGGLAARADVRPDGSLHPFVNTHWTYMNLNGENYERPAKLLQGHQGTVKVRFWKSP